MAALAAAALAAAPAGAAKVHSLQETFGSAAQPSFDRDVDIAVDQSSGDVLVLDGGPGKNPGEDLASIRRFHADGTPSDFAALGTNAIDAKSGPGGKPCAEEPASCDLTPEDGFSGIAVATRSFDSQIAIDESGTATDGNIYIVQPNTRLVSIFAADGHYLGELTRFGTTKFGEEVWGVAVDGAGNVYVSDAGKNAIHKFDPSVNPPLNTDFKGDFTTVTRPANLAVGAGSTAGYLFVVRAQGPVYKLDLSSGALKYVVAEGGPLPAPGGNQKVAVDPGTGHVLVANGTLLKEYDAAGVGGATLLSSTEFGGFSVDASAADGTSGEIYVSRGGSAPVGNHVEVLGKAIVTLPDVATAAATGITPTRATLNGTVNPDGAAVSECFFEYGEGIGNGAGAYDKTVPCEGAIPADSSDHTVTASIAGLVPSTPSIARSYYFRLRAASADGAVTGAGLFFYTASLAETKPATSITGTGATLNATVNPDGSSVSECLFEYGTTTAYGQTAPCAESAAEIGTGTSPVAVHAPIVGLAPNGAVYHFRIAAANADGNGKGADQSFLTPNTVVTGIASAIAGGTATLNGTLNPEGVPFSECFFEYGTTTAYGQTAPCAESAAEIGTGTSPVPVHAELGGLAAGAEYHFRLVGVNAGGSGQGNDASFLTSGPEIAAQWTASALLTEATVEAEINPKGSATTFHIEYGTSASYGQSTAESGSIGSGAANVTVAATLRGLPAGTIYHWHVVATNADGTSAGSDRTFTTFGILAPSTSCANQAFRVAAAAPLPDCRAYELVSPVEKGGGDVAVLLESGGRPARLDQSSRDGEKFTYSSYRSFGGSASAPFTAQYLATRGPGGWASEGISPPQEGPGFLELEGLDTHYNAFSDDLCSGWVLQDTEMTLTPDAVPGYADLYRRDNCGGGGYEALTTVAPEVEPKKFRPSIQGFSEDGSHAVFRAAGKLTADASSAVQLYEHYDGGKLRLVCILPDGTPLGAECTAGTFTGGSNRLDNVWHAISDDGSRIFWSTLNGLSDGRLYLRIDGEETVAVSQSNGFFWGAAADGSRAIFSEGSFQSGVAELYEYDVEAGVSQPIAADVQGVMGMSDDASRVYFVSSEALDGKAVAGKPNLYLHRAGAGGTGTLTFVATLSTADLRQQGDTPSPLHRSPTLRTSRVTPDGLHATFMSSASLTGYDNTDAQSGKADAEVFIYDAEAAGLACVSCNPTGARPAGKNLLKSFELWAAARIPGWEYQQYGSRVLSDDGSRLFFNSFEALVLRDTNSKQDVYEWERAAGQSDCEALGAELYVPSSGGCLSLISSGESPSDSEFIDASADGRDAFFTTAASLLPQDPGLVDVYDARAGGGFPPAPEPGAACEGEACQGPLALPNDPTPASSAFQGAGNVREGAPKPRCAKGKARRKGRCVAKKHKRNQQHHAKRANRNPRSIR